MEAEATSVEFQELLGINSRGNFAALNVGLSPGQGSKEPVNLKQRGPLQGVADRLLANDDVQRMAHYHTSRYFSLGLLSNPIFIDTRFICLAAFQLWCPSVFEFYKKRLDDLYKSKPELKRITPRGIYPTAAFNFGPSAWTHRHRDVMNCAFGWCAIQALGSFDHKKGGHLILPDLELVMEFPPASVILIPSATLIHANIPVQSHEKRASFTQYCPGGLLRYVDNDFKNLVDIKKEEYKDLKRERLRQWSAGVAMYKTVKEIEAYGKGRESKP